jgi:hypothetical protein
MVSRHSSWVQSLVSECNARCTAGSSCPNMCFWSCELHTTSNCSHASSHQALQAHCLPLNTAVQRQPVSPVSGLFRSAAHHHEATMPSSASLAAKGQHPCLLPAVQGRCADIAFVYCGLEATVCLCFWWCNTSATTLTARCRFGRKLGLGSTWTRVSGYLVATNAVMQGLIDNTMTTFLMAEVRAAHSK